MNQNKKPVFLSFLKIFNKSQYFIIVLFLITIFLSLLKIHGSSIGYYHDFFYGSSIKDPALVAGKPRPIRSDEWLVSTPSTIDQYSNNFTHINPKIGLGQEMSVIYDTPTNHWSTIFKPSNWSFFVMPLENAFAFKWWFRSFLLITSCFLLLLYLTKRRSIAGFGSLIIYFSPFIQWWYSTSIETITYGVFVLVFSLKVFDFRNVKDLMLNSSLLIYFLICFALNIYPPFQLSIAFLIFFLLVGWISQNRKTITRERTLIYTIYLLVILLIVALAIFKYFSDFKEIFLLMQNTTYPGKRVITGGNFSIIQLLSGFFDIQLYNENSAKTFANQSEASSFFMFWPALIPFSVVSLVINYTRKRGIDYIILSLIAYLTITIIWVVIGFPSILAKATLFYLIPENRMIIGIGLANLILVFYLLKPVGFTKFKKYNLLTKTLTFLTFILTLRIGRLIEAKSPIFIHSDLRIFIISFIAALLVFFLLRKKTYKFLILLLVFSFLSTYKVNPIYQGLNSVIGSDLSVQLKKISSKNHTWLVNKDLVLSHYLQANGFKTISGTYFYPQLKLWHKFDPTKKYENIYNRYAHVVFDLNTVDKTSFVLNQADNFTIMTNPCNPLLKELDVEYLIFYKRTSLPCIKEVGIITYPKVTVYIYQRQDIISNQDQY